MSLADRTLRSLFVALAVGLGWGIRGDFGHLVGAMYPGAALAMALAFVSGQRSLFLWMPVLAGVTGLAIGSGGSMSYGILHGYAQSDTPLNYGYGFLTLFLQGSAWGTFGGALLGLMLERKPMRTGEWLGLIGSVLAAGWLTSFLVVDVLGFQINPPRNNSSIAFMGAALGQLIWLASNNKPTGLRGALLGYLGFGLGMAGGRLLGNLANALQEPYGFTINHWNVMEVSCGMIGGFIFAFGMLKQSYPEPPPKENLALASVYGIIYALGVTPLWHRLGRIQPEEKLQSWSESLRSYGSADPDGTAQTILWGLDAVCVLGFLGAALWLVIHFRQQQRWAMLPVMWLSGVMLLFQNLNALYLLYPARPGYVNMHHVFWAIFGLMALYAALARPKPPADTEVAEDLTPARAAGWLAAGLFMLGAIIFLAGYTNGEATMRSANTRWPIWSWSQGPFPRPEKSQP